MLQGIRRSVVSKMHFVMKVHMVQMFVNELMNPLTYIGICWNMTLSKMWILILLGGGEINSDNRDVYDQEISLQICQPRKWMLFSIVGENIKMAKSMLKIVLSAWSCSLYVFWFQCWRRHYFQRISHNLFLNLTMIVRALLFYVH